MIQSARSALGLVVIPCLNEATHIESVLRKICAEAEPMNLRIVVADGGSTDGTREIVQRQSHLNRRITLMDNPGRIQSIGINRAAWNYGNDADFLIRIDAHASYPSHYCEQLLRVQARTRADSVVVSMRTAGTTCFERAAAAAQNSLLGHGGSAHRQSASGSWVDHGHHALMTMHAFRSVGGYDETFSHNEDAELDARLIASGFHIFLTGETEVTYHPRGSAPALFRQYCNIGQGRARTLLKHRKNAKLRHFVLAGVAPALGLLLLFPLAQIFALPAVLWAFSCLAYGVVLAGRLHDPCAAAAGLAGIAMQSGWSIGFYRGLYTELPKRLKTRELSDPVTKDSPPL
jgi:succinoglycan biosynthesis protein ExoA